ncbi:MAG: formylglycine-generating enzyme family protein [Victivallales bacterium]|nr:formylglycine-generating enzyme family protein [Victivallales bacterium]
MSYIDEICGYLLIRGYVTREEVSKLMKGLGEPSEALFENYDEYEYDKWVAQEEEREEEERVHLEVVPAGGGRPISRRQRGKFGGRRTSGGNNVKITAPELDAKLPTMDLGAKLKDFLTLLQWLDGTGGKESSWSWESFVQETDKFYEMAQDGLTGMLKCKNDKEIKHHVDLLMLYCEQSSLLPDVLDGYVGAVVAAFNSEMGDYVATEWTVNKHSWIYRYPNIRTMKRAVIVHNRLRHALVSCLKEGMFDSNTDEKPESKFGANKQTRLESDSYTVVDLTTGDVKYSAIPPNLNDDRCRTTKLWLRKIPKGRFVMGSPEDEVGHNGYETSHDVELTQDFYIGVFQCTQKQWELVMGDNPSEYKGVCRPVENVSYDMIRGMKVGAGWPANGHAVDGLSFMGRLREMTGLIFDLPTEAQWEYACRAGTETALNSGMNLTSTFLDVNINELGRYYYNQRDGKGGFSEHTKVGCYMPNGWGLYDMHGNVWEWCLDWYGEYGTSAVTDPVGPNVGSYRRCRGGSWRNLVECCRSAYRYSNDPSYCGYWGNGLGFRVVCLPSS